MKSVKFSVISGAAVAVVLVLLFVAFDFVTRARIRAQVATTLNSMSLPLLEQGDPSVLFSQLDEGIELVSPDMGFIRQYWPLVALDPWQGDLQVPSFFANQTPRAALATRAHFAKGVADLRAQLVYRDSRWRVHSFEVIQGPASQ